MNAALPATVSISPIKDIVADMAAGRMVILIDEEDRENEGDLVLAADHVSAEAINFMARFGRGLICLTLTRERCERLHLPPMVSQLTAPAPCRLRWLRRRRPATWCNPAIFSRCKRSTAVCSCALVTPKRAATWPPWPAAHRRP